MLGYCASTRKCDIWADIQAVRQRSWSGQTGLCDLVAINLEQTKHEGVDKLMKVYNVIIMK